MIHSVVRLQPRRAALFTMGMLAMTIPVFAQAPWERAAKNLALTFTGPLARSLWSPL